MKKLLTLLFYMLFITAALQAQDVTYLWGGPGDANSEFDGGLNDWTTIGVSSVVPDSAENAVWVWTPDGRLDSGSFWGDAGTIASPSVANGAAGFDSDFLDNNGDALDNMGNVVNEAFGTGAAPSPHRGELISPVIDMTGNSTVILRFYQSYRNFNTSSLVEVTNGTDSVIYQINEEVPTNEGNTENLVTIDISEVAANQSNVRIKFIFDGDYYYWIVDDVALIEKPLFDLAISEFFYPLLSMATPVSQIKSDTLGFSAEVANLGSADQFDVELRVRIFNADDVNTPLFADSLVIDTLPAGFGESIFDNDELDSTLVAFGFDTTFFVPDLDVGTYLLVYDVSVDGQEDFNGENNLKIEPFFVTEDQYAKERAERLQFGWNSDDSDFKVGNMYTTDPNSQEDYVATSYTFAAFDLTTGDLGIEGKSVTLILAELNEDLLQGGFDNFEFGMDIVEDNQSLSTVGINSYTFTADDAANDFVTVDLLELNSLEKGVPLKKGNRYFALASYTNPNNTVNHGVATDEDEGPAYHSGVNTVIFESGTEAGTGTWFTGGFQDPQVTFILRMSISLSTSIDEVPLPDHAVKVFPNPTAQYINLDLDLEEAGPATVTIADLSGRVLRIDELENTQRETRQYQVGSYAAGTYIVRVATQTGTKTLRFIVTK